MNLQCQFTPFAAINQLHLTMLGFMQLQRGHPYKVEDTGFRRTFLCTSWIGMEDHLYGDMAKETPKA